MALRRVPLLEVAASSTVGQNRYHNEDAWGADVDAGIVAVADGCGGASPGTWAAEVAVAHLLAHGRHARAERDGLAIAIERANAEILSQATSAHEKRGTGTTVAAIRVDDAAITIAWVGDCRVYELKAGRLERVTVDHIMANEPSYADIAASADESVAGILLRAVGVGREVVVDIRHRPRSPGALYLIASDGLTAALSDADIHRIVGDEALPLQARCDALVQAADSSGGHDNVTVALVRPL